MRKNNSCNSYDYHIFFSHEDVQTLRTYVEIESRNADDLSSVQTIRLERGTKQNSSEETP